MKKEIKRERERELRNEMKIEKRDFRLNGEIVAGSVCHTGWVGLCEKGAQETPERHTDRTQRHTHRGTTLSKGFRTNQNTISSYEELYRQRTGLKDEQR